MSARKRGGRMAMQQEKYAFATKVFYGVTGRGYKLNTSEGARKGLAKGEHLSERAIDRAWG